MFAVTRGRVDSAVVETNDSCLPFRMTDR